MKCLLPLFFLLYSAYVFGQITFDVENDNVSFRDNFVNTDLSTWTPMQLQFFVPDLSRESTFSGAHVSFVNTATDATTILENGSLKFQEVGGNPFPEDKMRLTKDQLLFVNDASWGVFQANIDGAGAGMLDINNPSGSNRINMNVTADAGTIFTYGTNGNFNAGISTFNGSNRGYIFVSPSGVTAEAGMYIDNADQGIIFGDIKNFRMKQPEKDDTEIWYASIEGPEVAAYDRGTAQLKDGEAFVSFKDHFEVVANTDNMTVIVTPLEWDTYGLAVIEKTEKGFKVKELKGGKGNFQFDWEVKCVRRGKENYQVERASNPELDLKPQRKF